ncbi:MAG: YceD family protein [Acidimicrobiales bacterium]
MPRPFAVNVAALVHRPGARRQEQVAGSIPGLVVLGTAVPDDGEVVVDALFEWVSDGLLATGTASGRWVGECRRCLRPVTGELTADFCELFEESPREGESYQLRVDAIDLTPLAREAILLELPLAPVCAADCRGLCPTCGTDLNQASCACVESARDPRWAALDVLRGDTGPAG